MSFAALLRRPRAWMWAGVAAVLMLAGLGLLSWHDGEKTARPALWRISRGPAHAWILGTMHAVPRGADWRSPQIVAATAASDRLVLEVAGLSEERRQRATFERLGRSPGLAALDARLAPSDRPLYRRLAAHLPTSLDPYEDWAAALLIGASASAETGMSETSAPEAGLDAIFRAAGKPVLGLETVAEQLGRFDTLNAGDQRALIGQALREVADAPRLYPALYRSWASGNLAALEKQFGASLGPTPGLRVALVDRPNQLWADRIDAMMREGRAAPFIALGAGHLVGPGNILARLAAKGWSIDRVQ